MLEFLRYYVPMDTCHVRYCAFEKWSRPSGLWHMPALIFYKHTNIPLVSFHNNFLARTIYQTPTLTLQGFTFLLVSAIPTRICSISAGQRYTPAWLYCTAKNVAWTPEPCYVRHTATSWRFTHGVPQSGTVWFSWYPLNVYLFHIIVSSQNQIQFNQLKHCNRLLPVGVHFILNSLIRAMDIRLVLKKRSQSLIVIVLFWEYRLEFFITRHSVK